jgi:hypothetical protein
MFTLHRFVHATSNSKGIAEASSWTTADSILEVLVLSPEGLYRATLNERTIFYNNRGRIVTQP